MLGYGKVKNHAGMILVGDYATLRELHEVIHKVVGASALLDEPRHGEFLLGLAYDVRKAFELQREVFAAPAHYEEMGPRYGVKVLNRALEGIRGGTIVHLCFGYAHYGQARPAGYSFLPQLAACSAEAISIEAAQAKLDLAVLKELAGKKIVLGVISLGDPEAETPEVVAARIREGLKFVAAERLTVSPDCGMKYLPRKLAFRKLKALHDGAAIVRKEIGK